MLSAILVGCLSAIARLQFRTWRSAGRCGMHHCGGVSCVARKRYSWQRSTGGRASQCRGYRGAACKPRALLAEGAECGVQRRCGSVAGSKRQWWRSGKRKEMPLGHYCRPGKLETLSSRPGASPSLPVPFPFVYFLYDQARVLLLASPPASQTGLHRSGM